MNKNILMAVTIAYGLVIALLAVLDVDSLGVIAAVGAIVVGGAWGVLGIFSGKRPQN
ncbi:hypothetical protein [Actinomadura algeriensis]|uniref:Uncharacterized protein n=1 Tax=Actinomadura algeriensis TaxID=1679523 RepID=A0ABR9JWU5_9ACTN|nr:hypothetical protein [Actinomadura algeriensis]MBE1535046.1 hypothetical protein [Actinomadura algeriensis]